MAQSRCPICNRLFTQQRSNAKTCSEKCSREYSKRRVLERYHQLHPDASYGKRGRRKAEQCESVGNSATKTCAKDAKKVDKRSARSKIKDLMRMPEQPNEITKEEKQEVNRIMALPAEERWNAGAKNWTQAQHNYAKRIEIKRISSNFSSIFSSFNRHDYSSLPFCIERKKPKEDLPYKFDIFTDDSDSSSELTESTAESTDDNDEEAQESNEMTIDNLVDEEVDETDEENQF